jgi:hypothetical protein
VLSLIFLKFASDKFEERRQELLNVSDHRVSLKKTGAWHRD